MLTSEPTSVSKSPTNLLAALDNQQNSFNFLRLIAALSVVLFHTWHFSQGKNQANDPITIFFAPHINLGELAVALFFFISGLLVSRSFCNDPHFGRFLIRRLARILPGLWFCLLISCLFASLFYSESGWRTWLQADTWKYLIGNGFIHFLRDQIPATEWRIAGVYGGQDLNAPLWTLYWEARMYLMVALLGAMAVLPLRLWFAICSAFLLFANYQLPQVLGHFIWETQLWTLFLMGIVCHCCAAQLRISARVIFASLALFGLMYAHQKAATGSGLSRFAILYVFCLLILYVGCLKLAFLKHLQKHDYSYAAYIYHWPVCLFLQQKFSGLDPYRLFALACFILLPICWFSWHKIEQPALAYCKKRFLR